MLVGSKSSHFVACEEVPYDGRGSSVVGNNQTAGSAFARGVDGNPRNIFPVPGEAALYGQGVVVKAQDDIALGVEQEGAGGGAWLKSILILARSGRLELDVCRADGAGLGGRVRALSTRSSRHGGWTCTEGGRQLGRPKQRIARGSGID